MAFGGAARTMRFQVANDEARIEEHMGEPDEVPVPRRRRGGESPVERAVGLGRDLGEREPRPVSESRRVCRRKLWNSCALASTRTGRDQSRHEYRRVTNSWVLGANATWRGSERPSSRATWACAAGRTLPKTCAHLRSASVAESDQ